MYNQVIFYNSFGAGDIFESREFVKQCMKLVPSNSYYYAHGKNPRILLDIDGLQYKEFTHHMDSTKSCWYDNNGNLYINTWIGRDGKYVLPGIGCTVEKLYDMYNDLLGVYSLGTLSGNPIDYIPDIDYSYYKIDAVDDFMKSHPEEKIFIDNGVVQSNQAFNFPFHNIIYKVASNNKDKCFIVSQGLPIAVDNVYPMDYVARSQGWGFDLNELSYASTFCSTLIGRNSGPHVFSQVKINVMDKSKKLLSFTYEAQGASFVVNTDVKIRRYWSPATKVEDVIQEIGRILLI